MRYFLVTALTHGRQARVSAAQPLLAIGSLLAPARSRAPRRPRSSTGTLLAVIGVGGLVCLFTTGEMAAAQDRVLKETSQLRAAVHAQLLRQQERDVDRLNETVVGMIHRNGGLLDALHDASSAAELLAGMEHRRGPAFLETLAQLREPLARMERIAGEISEEGRRNAGGTPEPVELLPIVGLVCEGLGYLFPSVKLEQRLEVPPETTVLVCGGASSLRRILENALVNACEGDGLRSANRVMLRCEIEREWSPPAGGAGRRSRIPRGRPRRTPGGPGDHQGAVERPRALHRGVPAASRRRHALAPQRVPAVAPCCARSFPWRSTGRRRWRAPRPV